MALALLDVELAIGLPDFMARLAGLVGGAFVAAWLVRRLVRPATLAGWREPIDGLAVLNLFVFALAIMDGVTAFALQASRLRIARDRSWRSPSISCCRPRDGSRFAGKAPSRALTAALVSGNCNMGLVLVALSGHAGIEVTAFFALAQVPMYMLPALLEPLYRRARAGAPATGSREAARPR